MKESFDENNPVLANRASSLREYYSRYLQIVRGLSIASVRHYHDALNNISKRLVSKGLVDIDIYEITDLEYLEYVRDILYADPEFIELNERGKRMYSAGLNNYIRFASGEEYKTLFGAIQVMDIPLKVEAPVKKEQSAWKRSGILRVQTLVCADYKCEIDKRHETFIAEKTNKPYMESHHAIPMRQQPCFDNSLDVYANLVCLCPICHRRIHYGIKTDRESMILQIYQKRSDRLAQSGIRLSQAEFVKFACGSTGD